MLSTAEDLCGPYVWGVYDLLVLPPSFPYGGMENPCLTFVTPTLLVSDRVCVIACACSLADLPTFYEMKAEDLPPFGQKRRRFLCLEK